MTGYHPKKSKLRNGLFSALFCLLAVAAMLIPREGFTQSNTSPGFLQPTPIYFPYFKFDFPHDWVTNPNAQPPVDKWTSEVSNSWCHLQAVEDEALANGVSLGPECTDYVTPLHGGIGPFAGMPSNQSLSPHQLIAVPFLYWPYCGLRISALTPQNPAQEALGWDFNLQDNYTYTGCWGVDDPVAVPWTTRSETNPQATNVMLADSGSDWHNDEQEKVGFLPTDGPNSMDPVDMAFELDFFPATAEGYVPISVASGYFYEKPPANSVTAAGTPTTGLFQDQMQAWMKSPVAYRAWRKMIPPPDTVILSRGTQNPSDPHATQGYVTFIRGQGLDVNSDCIKNNLSACTNDCGASLASPSCATCLMQHPTEAAALNNCPRHIAYTESDRSKTFALEGTSDPVFIGYIPNTMNRWHQDLGPFCEGGVQCIPNKNCADFCATAGCGATCDDGCNAPISCGPCPPTPPAGCIDNCDSDFCQDPNNCGDSCVDCQTGNTVQCTACPNPPGCTDNCDSNFCQSLNNCGDHCVDCQSGNSNDCGPCLSAIAGCQQDCDAYCSQNCNDTCTKCSDGSVVTCDCGPPPTSPPAGCRSDCDDQFCQDVGHCGQSCVDCESGKTNDCADCIQPPANCISNCDTTFCQDSNNCGQSCIDCETGVSTTCGACVTPPQNCVSDCTSYCASNCSGSCTQCDGTVVDCTCLPPTAPPTNTLQDCINKCSSDPVNLCEWECPYDSGTYTCPSSCPSTVPPTPTSPTEPLPVPTPNPSNVTTADCFDAADSCEAACTCAGCTGNGSCLDACNTNCTDPSNLLFGLCAYNAVAAANVSDVCTAMPPDMCPHQAGFQQDYPKTCSDWCECINCHGSMVPTCPDVCGMYCGSLENTSQFKSCAQNLEKLQGTNDMPCADLRMRDVDRAFEVYLAKGLEDAGDAVCSEAEAVIPTAYDQNTGTGPGYTGPASTNTDDCTEMCQLVGADPNRSAKHGGLVVSADIACKVICEDWCGDNPKNPSVPPLDNLAQLYPLRPEQQSDLATCLAVRGGFFTLQSLSEPSVAYVGDGYSNLDADPKFDTATYPTSGGWRKIVLNYDPANYLKWNPCFMSPSYASVGFNSGLPAGLKKPWYTVRDSAYCNQQHDAKLKQDASNGFESGTFFVLNRGPVSCWRDIDFRNPRFEWRNNHTSYDLYSPDAGFTKDNFRMAKGPGHISVQPGDAGDDSCGYITFYAVENTPNGLQLHALDNAQGDILKVPTGLNPTFATVGDFNGDGSSLDIAVTNAGSQNQDVNGSVSVMFCAPGPSANFKGGGSAAGSDICPCGAVFVNDFYFDTADSNDSVHPWAISSDVLMGKKITYDDSEAVIDAFNKGEFTPASGEICNDGVDNDADSLIDCFDPDCDTFCKSVIRAPEDLVVTFLDAYKAGHNDFAVLRNVINGNDGKEPVIDPHSYFYQAIFRADHYRDHADLSSQYNSPELQNKPIKLLAKDYGAYPLGVASGFFGETSDYSFLPLGTGVWLENVIGYMFPGFTISQGGLTSPCSQLMLGFHNSRNVGRYHQVFPENINPQWGAWNNPQQSIQRCTAKFAINPEDVTDATTPIYNAANTGFGGQGLGWGPKALQGYYSNAYTERTYKPGTTDWLYVDPQSNTLNLDSEIDLSPDLMGVNGNTLNLYETQFVDNNYAEASYLPEFNPACEANNFELFNLIQDTTDTTPASNTCVGNMCSETGPDPETPNRCYQRWGADNAAGYACCLILESPGDPAEVQKITDSDLWPSTTACPFVDPMQCCIDQLSQQNFSIDQAHQTVHDYSYNGNQGCAPDCRNDLRQQIDAAFAAGDWATQWDLTLQLNCTCMPNPTFIQQGLCAATTTLDCSTLGNATAIACCQDPNSPGCDPCSLAPDPDCCRNSAACPQQTPPPCSCSDLDASIRDCCVDQAGTQPYASCNELLNQIDFSQCAQQLPPTSCESTYAGDQTSIDCCNGDSSACCDLQPTADMQACCKSPQDPACSNVQQQGPCTCEQFSGALRSCCLDQFGSGNVDCQDIMGMDMTQCLQQPPAGICDPNDADPVKAGFAKDFQQCCQRYDGNLVMALSSGDSDCPGAGTAGCNIDFTNNGVINGNVQLCCECFNIPGSHNDISCTQSCATIYQPTPDPNFCLAKRALNQPLPVECTATCDQFPDSPICQKPGQSPKIFCDELLSWEDVTDWSNLANESKAKANLQGLCASASGNDKCLGILLHGSARLKLNIGSTISLMGLSMDQVKGQNGTVEVYQTQGVAPESMDTDLAGLSFLTTQPGSIVSGMTQLVGGTTPISENMALTMKWPYEQVSGKDALNKFQVKVSLAGEDIVCDAPPVLRSLSVAGGESGPSKGCALVPNGTRGPVDFMAVLLLLGLVGTTTRWAYGRKKRK